MSFFKQLLLPFVQPAMERPTGQHLDSARRLRLFLEAKTGEPIHLTVTDNRRSIVTVRRRPDGVSAVRLHHIFLHADGQVLKSLARYIERRDRRASTEIGQFIAERQDVLSRSPRRRRTVLLRTRGHCHDLQLMFDELNHRYFAGSVKARITFAAAVAPRGRRRRHSIKLGTYSMEEALVRIHPKLDADWVPRFFVEWIVFHEMLHHVLGVKVDEGGRRSYHSPEFRERERTYARFDEAREWERVHIDRLLA